LAAAKRLQWVLKFYIFLHSRVNAQRRQQQQLHQGGPGGGGGTRFGILLPFILRMVLPLMLAFVLVFWFLRMSLTRIVRVAGGAGGGYPPPPAHYICNRCEKPGHWKKDCPTIGDVAFDQKKFSVGIPVSRTKIISEEDAAASSEGVRRLPDGRLVQCMPSEYVQSLVAVPLIACLLVFPLRSRLILRSSMSVMIQYSALFLRVFLPSCARPVPRCIFCSCVCVHAVRFDCVESSDVFLSSV